jgi:zinc transport system substrate-binding protein
MIKKIVVVICLCLSWCSWAAAAPSATEVRRLRVVTTLFALYDFTREVGQDRVEATLLLPPGVEAHAFEPKPQDVMRIRQADVFIFTGSAMEPWVADVLAGIGGSALIVLNASEGQGASRDPHIWLDFSRAEKIVDAIADVLARRDPSAASFYRENARAYQARLRSLDRAYQEAIDACPARTIVFSGHGVFGLWGQRYGLRFISPYRGFSPDAEPTPRRLAELISGIKKLKARAVYHEELIDPKVGRVIAEETGATLVLLHGAHNISREEKEKGATFIGLMEENLKNLNKGMMC